MGRVKIPPGQSKLNFQSPGKPEKPGKRLEKRCGERWKKHLEKEKKKHAKKNECRNCKEIWDMASDPPKIK